MCMWCDGGGWGVKGGCRGGGVEWFGWVGGGGQGSGAGCGGVRVWCM